MSALSRPTLMDNLPQTIDANTAIAKTDAIKLLIITDQKDSSKLGLTDVTSRAAAHFKSFISLLVDQFDQKTSAYVVKNIGDSLMIYVDCPVDKLASLLYNIALTRKKLEDDLHILELKLRVVVLEIKYFVDGQKIEEELSKPPNVPFGFWEMIRGGQTWLRKDLFGPRVALAFRAASLFSEALFVVEDSIAELIQQRHEKTGKAPFDVTVSIPGRDPQKLWFSEELPFSPLKGVDTFFPFGKEKTILGNEWRGHLFLRAVEADRQLGSKHGFLLEQQKYRVFFRLICQGNRLEPAHEGLFVDWLREIEGNARYLRSISIVRSEHIFKKQASYDDIHTGALLAFAGPLEATYTEVRTRIGKAEGKEIGNSKFRYAISTIVYTPAESEDDPLFWGAGAANCDWYALVLARWKSDNRGRQAREFSDEIDKCSTLIKKFGLKLNRVGLTVGGEWDSYARLVPQENGEGRIPTNEEFAAFSKALTKVIRKRTDIESYTILLCKQLAELLPVDLEHAVAS
jgi:hypothetical protein